MTESQSPSNHLTLRVRLPDQDARDRFAQETNRNFSVMAAAGAGKTTAIVSRILELAKRDEGQNDPVLPRLLVVTYTRKAAAEMRQRAQQVMVNQGLGPESLHRLQMAYFGTIHSLCGKLIREQAVHLGLSAELKIAERETTWLEWQCASEKPSSLREDDWQKLLRHLSLEHLWQLARSIPPAPCCPCPSFPKEPVVNVDRLLQFQADGRNRHTVEREKQRLKKWISRYYDTNEFLPLPSPEKGGQKFLEEWEAAFRPLREWLRGYAAYAAQELARQARRQRWRRKEATYDDLLDLAVCLLREPATAKILRERRYVVLLDEAQDTDPRQFLTLTELARPDTVTGIWLEGDDVGPEPGRFCMVGDPQQSIYSDRADLSYYLGVHRKLIRQGVAEELHFTVTMRCARSIVETVNRVFPPMFRRHRRDGEVDGNTIAEDKYTPLHERPGAPDGAFEKLKLVLEETADKHRELLDLEAHLFAQWLVARRPHELEASSWAQVAVLAPRNDWLLVLSKALKKLGFPHRLQSHRQTYGDDPFYAWTTALITVMAEPENGFELYGVLREIFGVDDDSMARWLLAGKNEVPPRRLQILRAAQIDGWWGGIVDALRRLREQILPLPLGQGLPLLLAATHLGERMMRLELRTAAEWKISADCLAAQALQAEQEGLSWREWARRLRARREEKNEREEETAEVLQLLSIQKAKGLEWDAILVPFLRQPVSFAQEAYPQVLQENAISVPQVLLDKNDGQGAKARLRQQRQEELDRVLYVAMTRARHRCLLVETVAELPQTKSYTTSLAERLLILGAGDNADWWNNLPLHRPAGGGAATHRIEVRQPDRVGEAQKFSVMLEDGQLIAGCGNWKRTLPSALVREAEKSYEPEAEAEVVFPGESKAAEAGRVYGLWWHEMMEHLPWNEGWEACRGGAREWLGCCPDLVRGEQEWTLFCRAGIDRLCGEGWLVRTEVPLFWRRGEGEVVEGIVDWLAYHPLAHEWHLLDWKTDRLPDSSWAERLRETYAPQIELYRESIVKLYGGKISAWLYSTAQGKLVRLGAEGAT